MTGRSILTSLRHLLRQTHSDWPVFGIAVNLGTISSTTNPVVWGLGVVRNPVTQYPTDPGVRRPYFFSDLQIRGKGITDAIDSFLQDYDSAVKRADALDAQILADATMAAPKSNGQYYQLLSFVVRQVMAAIEFTVLDDGTQTGLANVKAFMRNTGRDR
jgi:hypothetical protein